MAHRESLGTEERGLSSGAPDSEQERTKKLRHYVPADILDVRFPVSVRGYDRRAVEAYVKRVNRVIAELKVSASPPAAVRHALDQAEEKVEALLQAAREAAEEITSSARREAEESTARAKAEAAELVVNTSAEADRIKAQADELTAKAKAEARDTVAKAEAEADRILAAAKAEAQNAVARANAEADERLQRSQEEVASLRAQAETRMHELQTDTEAIWTERRELLEDVRAMASGLVDLANAAAKRVSPRGEPESGEEGLEPTKVVTEEPTRVMSEDRDDARSEAEGNTVSRPTT